MGISPNALKRASAHAAPNRPILRPPRDIRSGNIPPAKRAGFTCGENMVHGPSAILQVTCPLIGIGLPSPWRSAPCRCLMVTLVPRMLITLLCPLLRPRRKWNEPRNPKLTCPLAPLAYRKKFSAAADALQLSAALRGPRPRQSHLAHFLVFPNPEEDMETLIRIRCPKNRRPASYP